MKYITVDFFIDGDDDKVEYPVGALYPRKGYTPSPERIEALLTGANARGVQLIKPIIELPAKGAVVESETVVESESGLDREVIKAKLEELGVAFNKKASTEKLSALLKEQETAE